MQTNNKPEDQKPASTFGIVIPESVTKLLTRLSQNEVTLRAFILLIAGLYLLAIFFAKSLIGLQTEVEINDLGSIVALLFSLALLSSSVAMMFREDRDNRELSKQEKLPHEMLQEVLDSIDIRTSQKILSAIKKLYATHTNVTTLDIYRTLRDIETLKAQHYHELSEFLLDTDKDIN